MLCTFCLYALLCSGPFVHMASCNMQSSVRHRAFKVHPWCTMCSYLPPSCGGCVLYHVLLMHSQVCRDPQFFCMCTVHGCYIPAAVHTVPCQYVPVEPLLPLAVWCPLCACAIPSFIAGSSRWPVCHLSPTCVYHCAYLVVRRHTACEPGFSGKGKGGSHSAPSPYGTGHSAAAF